MNLADYIGKYWAGAEAIYAVIIAMTFTSVLRDNNAAGEGAYSYVVYSALFCCIAWGIADGAFYAWERKYNILLENKIIDFSRSESEKDNAIPMIKEQLDDTILRNINEENRTELYQKLVRHLAEFGVKGKPSARDAIHIISATFLISTIAGLIVVAPFFLIDNLNAALPISNLLGVSLLFIIGYNRAREKDFSAKVILGFGTAIIGMIIAVITTFLGG
jgi:hypothetical protein